MININCTDIKKITPLWAACQVNNIEIVKLLLEYGADPNIVKSDGCSPLWIAASKGYSECVQILIKYDANIDGTDNLQVCNESVCINACNMNQYSFL